MGWLDEPERAASELERLQELTKEALVQMRRVITELHPSQESLRRGGGAPASSDLGRTLLRPRSYAQDTPLVSRKMVLGVDVPPLARRDDRDIE